MANSLTGDYDAVLLIQVKKINAILATLHQNGGDEDASPSFPHSATIRLEDRWRRPDLAGIAEWLNTALATPDLPRGDLASRVSAFLDTAPPGASRDLGAAFVDLQSVRNAIPDPQIARGTADVQLSAPSISLAPGSISEVTVHVSVRARYSPDPGTLPLPERIHGEVRATYSVKTKRMENYGALQTILEVEPPQDSSKVQFVPSQSGDLIHAAQIAEQIAKVLRKDFEPVNVELPGDSPFRQLKEVAGGHVLALPLVLDPEVEPSAQAIHTVMNDFSIDDFSIAISKEFVDRKLRPAFEKLLGFRRAFPNWWTTYNVAVTSVKLEWQHGAIDLVVKATAKADRAPDYDVTIRQRLILLLDPVFQKVSLGASNDDLTISLSGLGDRFLGFVRDRIRNAIIPERDAALNPPPPDEPPEGMINDQLNDARAGINDALASMDDSGSARYNALRVTPDGLVLDGSISTALRTAPVVEFEETRDGSAFTALKSWIPGGRIDRFEWSWMKFSRPADSPWARTIEVTSQADSFLLPKPAGIAVGNVCLRIEGAQIDPNGNQVLLSAGDSSCSILTPEVMLRVPAWLEPLMIPIWLPGTPPDGILEGAISGYVNVLAHSRPDGVPTTNSLVHFADPELNRPLDSLSQGLARRRRRNVPLLVIVVLPSGIFQERRRDVEAKLGSIDGFEGRLLLTQDVTGGWKRTFDAGRLPSSFLVNSRGEFVWKQEGVLESEALAAALDEHCTTGRPRLRWAGLTVRPGEPAPRAVFMDDRGQGLALRKLRGHPVLLNFWQSWSAPCIQELVRLQGLQEEGREDPPVIVAVNGSEGLETLAEVRGKHKLTYALAHDPEGLIARQFGVSCWPTTVSIDRNGFVTSVQSGSYSAGSKSAQEQAAAR